MTLHPFKNLWTMTECGIWKLIKWIWLFLFIKILRDNVLDIVTIFSFHWVKVGFEKVCSYCNICRHRWKLGSISVCWNGINYGHTVREAPSTKGENYRQKEREAQNQENPGNDSKELDVLFLQLILRRLIIKVVVILYEDRRWSYLVSVWACFKTQRRKLY